MTERETGEILQPPQKSSQQLVKELTERFARDIANDSEDHRQYMSQYPLPVGSLGVASLGTPDVAFEKFIELTSDGTEDTIMYTIFIGCDKDTVLTIATDDGELYGGFGEAGHSEENGLDPDEVYPLLTKLSALMWLHERGLDSPELNRETVVKTIVTMVESLVRTTEYPDDPDGDSYDVYPIEPGENVWSTLKAERWWSEDGPRHRLSLMDGSTEIIEISALENTGELLVIRNSDTEIEGTEAIRRARILFAVLAEAVASGQIVPKAT